MRRTFGKPAKRHNVLVTREAILRSGAEQRAKKNARTRQWWAGVLTLVLIVTVAAVLALGVQYGLDITRFQSARALYYVFVTLSSPGLLAGAVYESGGHGLIFQLREDGRLICMTLNGVIYGVLILIWLKYHGDARLKK